MRFRTSNRDGKWMAKCCTALSVAASCAFGLALCGSPAHAQLITPSFGTSITSDPNAATIESTINAAIAVYGQRFVDPINVKIAFGEMTTGLGESNTFFGNVNYSTFLAALNADASSADDATALGVLNPAGSAVNPVNGNSKINVKTANLRAVGISATPPTTTFEGQTAAFDGYIRLNTLLTTPGSAGSSLQYSLLAVVEHEIDEVLGLGSALPDIPNSTIFPEDLYRYNSAGNRTFTTAGDNAFFSIDGTTDIARFNQSGGGADYGDWHTGGTPQVQDAFGTPGASPVLGPSEIRALDVIGYTLAPQVTATPEFGSVFSLGSLLLAGGAGVWLRRRKSQA